MQFNHPTLHCYLPSFQRGLSNCATEFDEQRRIGRNGTDIVDTTHLRSANSSSDERDIMKSRRDLWDRRDVMIAGGAAIGGIALSQDVTGARAATPDTNCLIVADARIATSRDFAAQAVHHSERIAWIEGDITKLWYEELDARWRDKKIAVTGLTEYGVFFCLERLAMDRGLRVAFRGSHRRDRSRLLHDIHAPEYIITEQALNALSERHWPQQAARMAMASRSGGRMTSQLHKTSSVVGERWPLLVSWMIVPKRLGGERA
jgi:hypothetical protein